MRQDATTETVATTDLSAEIRRIIDAMIANPRHVVKVTRYGKVEAVIISAQAWDESQEKGEG